ncbi:hypothetical protein D7J45_22290 [Salmonella enterica]|nr:hypothetical protein [Salmonella enterica]
MPTSGITTACGRRVDTLKIFIPAAMFDRHKSRRLIQSKSLSHQALLAQPVWTRTARKNRSVHVVREV